MHGEIDRNGVDQPERGRRPGQLDIARVGNREAPTIGQRRVRRHCRRCSVGQPMTALENLHLDHPMDRPLRVNGNRPIRLRDSVVDLSHARQGPRCADDRRWIGGQRLRMPVQVPGPAKLAAGEEGLDLVIGAFLGQLEPRVRLPGPAERRGRVRRLHLAKRDQGTLLKIGKGHAGIVIEAGDETPRDLELTEVPHRRQIGPAELGSPPELRAHHVVEPFQFSGEQKGEVALDQAARAPRRGRCAAAHRRGSGPIPAPSRRGTR